MQDCRCFLPYIRPNVSHNVLRLPKGPKMVAVRNYHGTPTPPGKSPLCFQTGDYIELLKGDPDTAWWEVRHAAASV